MWYYQGFPIQQLEDLPDHPSLFGFCYRITNLATGGFYIGKKQFHSSRKKKLTKKETVADKRRKSYKIVSSESDWMNYWGSNEELRSDVKQLGSNCFRREIIALARSKKYLSYLEIKHQFEHDVLAAAAYNKNILGRFFPRDIEQDLPPEVSTSLLLSRHAP
jgi:hypothetical protein